MFVREPSSGLEPHLHLRLSKQGPAQSCRNGTTGTRCAAEVSLGLSAEWDGRAILGELQVKVSELAVHWLLAWCWGRAWGGHQVATLGLSLQPGLVGQVRSCTRAGSPHTVGRDQLRVSSWSPSSHYKGGERTCPQPAWVETSRGGLAELSGVTQALNFQSSDLLAALSHTEFACVVVQELRRWNLGERQVVEAAGCSCLCGLMYCGLPYFHLLKAWIISN